MAHQINTRSKVAASSFAIATTILAFAIGTPSLAQGPNEYSAFESLAGDAVSNDESRSGLHAPGPTNSDIAAARTFGMRPTDEPSGVGIRLLLNNPSLHGQNDIVENGWDFNNPDSIPGFSSHPYPVLSNPEILD